MITFLLFSGSTNCFQSACTYKSNSTPHKALLTRGFCVSRCPDLTRVLLQDAYPKTWRNQKVANFAACSTPFRHPGRKRVERTLLPPTPPILQLCYSHGLVVGKSAMPIWSTLVYQHYYHYFGGENEFFKCPVFWNIMIFWNFQLPSIFSNAAFFQISWSPQTTIRQMTILFGFPDIPEKSTWFSYNLFWNS